MDFFGVSFNKQVNIQQDGRIMEYIIAISNLFIVFPLLLVET